jgi:hypothetical protein
VDVLEPGVCGDEPAGGDAVGELSAEAEAGEGFNDAGDPVGIEHAVGQDGWRSAGQVSCESAAWARECAAKIERTDWTTECVAARIVNTRRDVPRIDFSRAGQTQGRRSGW